MCRWTSVKIQSVRITCVNGHLLMLALSNCFISGIWHIASSKTLEKQRLAQRTPSTINHLKILPTLLSPICGILWKSSFQSLQHNSHFASRFESRIPPYSTCVFVVIALAMVMTMMLAQGISEKGGEKRFRYTVLLGEMLREVAFPLVFFYCGEAWL